MVMASSASDGQPKESRPDGDHDIVGVVELGVFTDHQWQVGEARDDAPLVDGDPHQRGGDGLRDRRQVMPFAALEGVEGAELDLLIVDPAAGMKASVTHAGYQDTQTIARAMRANGFEGVCFKRTNGKYVNGRNEDQYKLKFWENATVRVKSKHATKSSVAIEVLNESNQWVGVGNVTEPANVPRPLIAGDLIDVRYLYAYQGGSLFEPTFDKIRDDLKESDALMSQLKFKRTAQAA